MDNEAIRFGRFRLDLGRRELRCDDALVQLHRSALDILCSLAAAKGEVVGKDALMARLWPGRVVEEGNLHVHISKLRKALDEHGEGHSHIVTVPSRGYRLVGFAGGTSERLTEPSRQQAPSLPDKPSIAVLPLANPRARLGKKPPRWLLWGVLGAIGGALCLAVLGGVLAGHSDRRLLSEDGPSIVVMPFRALDEKQQAKLGESIAEGLVRELSQLPGAQVVSSETARTYLFKSLDARQTRRELGVAYIVEGTVASAQPGVHAEATLINTLHDTVVRPLSVDVAETDVGPARDNIVTGLIWPLTSIIIEKEGQRAAQKPAAAQTANDLVWLSWSLRNRNLPYDNAVEVLGSLEKALQIDKKNVDALALMANHLIVQAHNYPRPRDYQSKLSVADSLLAEALIIQPSNVLADLDRCMLRRSQTRYEEAIAICQKLIDDLYRRPLAYKEIGWDYLLLGKPDQAVAAFTTADHLVKHHGVRWTWLIPGGLAYLQVGNYAEAIDWLRRALAERPRTYSAHVWLIAAYTLSGRQQDAATELAGLQRAYPELFSSDDALAQMMNAPGSPAFGENMRLVIQGLEKGGFPERMTKPLLAKTLSPGPP